MYNVNDVVLYGSQGTCRVTGIIKKDFYGKMVEYYELKPLYDDKSTFFVPTRNESSKSKLRSVLTEEEVRRIIKMLPEEDAVWIENEGMRKEKYREIISGGDSLKLAKVIRALHLYQQRQKLKGRKIHSADEQFLMNAEKVVCSEFAYVLNIGREQVMEIILAHMDSDEKYGTSPEAIGA